PAMTRLQARLTLFTVMAIFAATASNALFLQDRARLLNGSGLPSTAVSLTQLSADKAAPDNAGASALLEEDPKAPRLHIALQRELARRGYANQLRARPNGLRLAVLAYEFDNSLPLTGEPTEALLKRVLFDGNQGPRGSFTDRAEINAKLVMEAQRMLAGLGFFRGTFSGRIDVWTSNAIKDFERHRGIPQTGRLTDQTLLELISYSGQPIRLS
ncbi:MAG TPA: peptidoglycan-binding domain-containing protein, partial [Geobacterales bacterium]|nr:peptidoglycan-binding domain-containing protein [Geobacterales bacterium]